MCQNRIKYHGTRLHFLVVLNAANGYIWKYLNSNVNMKYVLTCKMLARGHDVKMNAGDSAVASICLNLHDIDTKALRGKKTVLT